MLKDAIDYEKELNLKLFNHFCDTKNQWYYREEGKRTSLKVTKDKIQFVSVDNEGKINGFISGKYNTKTQVISSLVLISFYNSNTTLMKDLITFFYKAYKYYNVKAISFGVYRDAPFYNQAVKAVNKFGTPVIQTSKSRYKLADGFLHYLDSFILEASTIDFNKVEKFLKIGKQKND